jgi:Tol biopolymer transport system component
MTKTAIVIPLLAALLAPIPGGASESIFLSGVRQLTFEGRRAGEGYFSADGAKMVFQSEREHGNPFYQIYLLDLESGDTTRISPGVGKTTCAWLHPDGDRVLFASTHLDPKSPDLQKAEFEERQSGRIRKYAWDYDENFDIFEFRLSDGSLTNLTNTLGYDAEGAYSPEGKSIVFASNRHAYAGPLPEQDRARLETDKQYFMEIYTADADGSNVRRLTDEPGYDGGPFFSADGARICWRRFNTKGDEAEVWTMNADGSDQRQITRLGAMSWAPFFHPSGEYLIFTTNLQGFANFELYIVAADGAGEPVRVTFTDGFDGLPSFSPDGETLTWTSGRTPGGDSQIFIANWNHQAALDALKTGAEKTPATAATATEPPDPPLPDIASTTAEIRAADMRLHVEHLASDELEGRLTGTRGERLATEYVARVMEHAGLLPFGDDSTWFEPFEFTAGVALGPGNEATASVPGDDKLDPLLAGLKPDLHWRPLPFSKTGEVEPSQVVFVGYGIETPDGATDRDGKPLEIYSSYAHADVEGKWVMLLRYLPEGVEKDRRNELSRYASLRHKALTAREKGARGIIVVSGPNSKVVDQLVPLSFDASLASSGLAGISVTDAVAEAILQRAGKSLKELHDKLDTGEMMGAIDCGPLALSARIDIRQEKRTGRNVLGVLPARNEPDFHTPPLIIGAHVDHLGTKGGGNSRARGDDLNRIHHGADDNASGVAGMLEIAQWLADRKKSGKINLTRDVIFAAWSGEELGLIGSNHFVESLARMIKGDPTAKLTGMMAACLNMDMIGRFNKTVVLQGVGSSPWWAAEIEKRNVPVGLPLTLQKDAHLPTDSSSFYLRGIPTLNAFTGAHEDYHMPSDTAEKIDYDKAADIARLMGLIGQSLATTHDIPAYEAMDAPRNEGSRGGLRAYLGTVPDYAQGDVQGVKLSGVSPVGPAAKAGVKAGDIIIKLAGRDIQNIYDYTYALGDLKIGDETDITVKRGEEEVVLKITPQSRD